MKRHTRPTQIIRRLESRVAIVHFPRFTPPTIPSRQAGLVLVCDPLAPPMPSVWAHVHIAPATAVVIIEMPDTVGPKTAVHLNIPPLNASLQLMAALGERPTSWRKTLRSMNTPRT